MSFKLDYSNVIYRLKIEIYLFHELKHENGTELDNYKESSTNYVACIQIGTFSFPFTRIKANKKN